MSEIFQVFKAHSLLTTKITAVLLARGLVNKEESELLADSQVSIQEFLRKIYDR